MKKLALVLLVCVLLPMQHGVIAQQPAQPEVRERLVLPEGRRQRLEVVGYVRSRSSTRPERPSSPGVSPSWSPDGLRIAYLAGNLYIYDRTARHQCHGGGGTALEWPCQLVTRRRPHRDSRIVRGGFRVDRGIGGDRSGWDRTLTRLTHGVGFQGTTHGHRAGTPSRSAATMDGVQELYVMGANGSNATRLTYRVGFAGAISWSPDGRRSRSIAAPPFVRSSRTARTSCNSRRPEGILDGHFLSGRRGHRIPAEVRGTATSKS